MEPNRLSIVQLFPRARGRNIVVGQTVVSAFSPNSRRTKLIIQNLGTGTIEMVPEESSVYGDGFQIIQGATYIDDAQTAHTGNVWLIGSAAGINVRIREEYHDLG